MRAISIRDHRGFRVEMLFSNISLEEVKLSDDIKVVARSSFQIGGCILINFICFFTLLFTILKPQFYDACLLTGL